MTNQLTINFSHHHYTNFDREKLFLKKSSIILLTTNQKWVDQGFLCSRWVKDNWNCKVEGGLENCKSFEFKSIFAKLFCKHHGT